MKKIIVLAALAAGLITLVYLHNSFSSAPVQSNIDSPSIDRMALLHASDVMAAAKSSLEQEQPTILIEKMKTVVAVAEEMGLAGKDLAYLASEQAKNYVLFHAKRDRFDDEVIHRYRSLQGIEDLKQRYPEAQDKFAKADAMIAKRDVLFSQLIDMLITNGLTPDAAKDQAKALWLKDSEPKTTGN